MHGKTILKNTVKRTQYKNTTNRPSQMIRTISRLRESIYSVDDILYRKYAFLNAARYINPQASQTPKPASREFHGPAQHFRGGLAGLAAAKVVHPQGPPLPLSLHSRTDSFTAWHRASSLQTFYRAMHQSAKRGLAIACRMSVCLTVCLFVRL